MLDLVGNPEARFSHNAAHMSFVFGHVLGVSNVVRLRPAHLRLFEVTSVKERASLRENMFLGLPTKSDTNHPGQLQRHWLVEFLIHKLENVFFHCCEKES